jgi:uncharacterized repeat protein (TIGR03803 family)
MTKWLRFPLWLASTLVLLAPRPLQAGSSKVSYRVLYSFQGQPDGAAPDAGLIRSASGTLYGTTIAGGTGTCDFYAPGCGTVFVVGSNGRETVLYSFTGPPTDGQGPSASLVQDSSGNLYGTTGSGGTGKCYPMGCGTVFKVDTTGTETVLYSFAGGTDGAGPTGVIRDANGALYGTTSYGGIDACSSDAAGCGTVFKVDSSGTETVLYRFTGGADGGFPLAGLVFDAAGNLYGATGTGGTGCGCCGCGVVFALNPSGRESVLYSFKGLPDGAFPGGGLIWDAEGNLYGTTVRGGKQSHYCDTGGCGTVFRLAPTGKETVLYRFIGPAGGTGYFPRGALIRDSAGNLYGTANADQGGCSCGLVFKLRRTGKLAVLHKFTGGTDGRSPAAPLIRDPKGILYGAAGAGGSGASCEGSGCGTVFKLTP